MPEEVILNSLPMQCVTVDRQGEGKGATDDCCQTGLSLVRSAEAQVRLALLDPETGATNMI